MNKQKRFNIGIILIIASMIFISGNIFTQQQERNQPPKPPSTEEVDKMVDELSAKLSLDKVQKQKISYLYTAHFNEVRKSTNNNEKNVGREEMEKEKRAFEVKIKSLLTDEQKAEFDKFMKNRGQQPNHQRPNH